MRCRAANWYIDIDGLVVVPLAVVLMHGQASLAVVLMHGQG